ncbi:MAG: PASTA domain-containing protein [Candidatus Methanosuratincola sp.]
MAEVVLKYRYALLKELGQNPFFHTWQAQDRLLDRLVVIKVVRFPVGDTGNVSVPGNVGPRDFVVAMQKFQSMMTPGWARWLGAESDQGQFFVVREYVEGYPLAQKIRLQAPLPWREAISILRLLSQMVATLHRQGWIHGHLHPSNIFISRQGHLKITDAGQAAALVQVYGILFTQLANPAYLAPEQLRGRPPQVASDLYGLGIVLYELLTGHPPSAPLVTPVPSVIPSPGEERGDIPPELDRITMRLLQSAPARRYSSATELTEDLKRLQQIAFTVSSQQEVRQNVSAAIPPSPRRVEVFPLAWRVIRVALRAWVVVVGILLSAGLCLALVVYGTYRYWEATIPPEVVVPDVSGQPLEEAQENLKKVGLRLAVEMEQFSEEVPAGHILHTAPSGGRRVRQGRLIKAVVSSGKEVVSTPNVVDRPLAQAREIIQQAGLRIGMEQEVNNELVPPHYVINQFPSAGDPVEKGGTVNIVVSKGPPDQAGELETEKSVQVEEKEKEKHIGRVKILMPTFPRFQQVKIVVEDSQGERVVYDHVHVGGEEITQEVSGIGSTLVKIFLDGKLVQSKAL